MTTHTRFYLELEPGHFFPDAFSRPALELSCLTANAAAFAAFLWQQVGEGFWQERHDWDLAAWQSRVADINVIFMAAYLDGEPVGCFELSRDSDNVRLEGFGLLPAYRGEGHSHQLLTLAVERALAIGAQRVCLDTATDDHPAALPLYQSQGFQVTGSEPLADAMA